MIPRLRSATSVLEPNAIASAAATSSSSRPASEAIDASIPSPWISKVGSPSESRKANAKAVGASSSSRVEPEVDPLLTQPPDQEATPAIPAATARQGDRRARPAGGDGDVGESSAEVNLEVGFRIVPEAGIGTDQIDETLAEADQRLPGVGRSHQREDRFCGMTTPIEERYVEIDGIRTFVRERPAEGPPTVFVHGNPTHSADWLPFMSAMDGPAIALDLPGFGRSERPGGDRFDYTMGSYGRFVGAVLDELAPSGFNLVVHDWGAVSLLAGAGAGRRCPAARGDQRRPAESHLPVALDRPGVASALARGGLQPDRLEIRYRAHAAARQARAASPCRRSSST